PDPDPDQKGELSFAPTSRSNPQLFLPLILTLSLIPSPTRPCRGELHSPIAEAVRPCTGN
ncbi:MAG TPA: hypothetical protein PKK50_10010, partial [Myxococcota bacterium]|nr:hypothetical protein [Myxococcota bacterium]